MNNGQTTVLRKTCALLFIILAVVLSSCAAPPSNDTLPTQFGAPGSGSFVETESEFRANIVGKQLSLLNDNIDASLVFNDDGTATGSVTRDGGETAPMILDWVWYGGSYCRTGTVGGTELTRKCETVRLFPGVGVLLTYVDSEDPDEYWLFE